MFEEKDFVNIKELILQDALFFAHRKEGKERETLEAHTKKCQFYFLEVVRERNAAAIFGRFADKWLNELRAEDRQLFYQMVMNTITFHDLGKINPLFQKNKMKNPLKNYLGDFTEEQARHSHLSAVMYVDYYAAQLKKLSEKAQRLLAPFLYFHAYMISKHHGSLAEFNDFFEGFYNDRSKSCRAFKRLKESKLYRFESGVCLDDVMDFFEAAEKERKSYSKMQSIWLYGYMRFLFSILVACDYYATTSYMNDFEIRDFGSLTDIDSFYETYQQTDLVKNIRKYADEIYGRKAISPDEKDIFILRNEMFLDAEAVLAQEKHNNFFFLEAPTGSGKSNTAINCSLKLIKENPGLQKIIYVYPFNTLVEQNIATLEKIYGADSPVFQKIAVVNGLTPMKPTADEGYDENYEKTLLDRQFLNYPFILTTHVSLFDTIFGNGRESVFAFHQLANAVIVLDEIQSYKNQIWTEIIMFLKGFAEFFNMKIIIMSATLPDFEQLVPDEKLCVRLITDRKKYFSHPLFKNRVQPSFDLLNAPMDLEKLLEHVKQSVQGKNKVLVEFMTRKSARQFYQRLKDEELDIPVEQMTGEDHSAERSRILAEISKPQEKGLILVATQVVEAGVDIDMDIGYKNYSKLDSEEQFLGRINRSGLRSGKVYFFQIDNPKNIYGGDFRINEEFTIRNREMQEVLVNKDFSLFYGAVLKALQENLNQSTAEDGLEAFFQTVVKQMDFTKVAKHMKLIDDDRQRVSVFFSGECTDDKTGRVIRGDEVWEQYVTLLRDQDSPYAERRVQLAKVRADMNYFLYQIPSLKYLPAFNDQAGEIYYVQDRSPYFREGKLDLPETVDFI